MKRLMVIILLSLVSGESSYACQRCGLFGHRCRYYKAPVVSSYVAPAVVYKQPEVFVVQNNYPQPIGAIAQQGNSVYGYQAAAQAYFVNPAEVIRQAAELSRAASATASIGLTGFNQTAQTQLALQASITEPLARGAAASQVLTAAGLSQPLTQSQSLALRVYQQNGQWKVESADPVQVNAQINQHYGSKPPGEVGLPIAPEPNGRTSILSTKCARCHGVSLSEPKGGIYFDAGQRINCDIFRNALAQVHSGKMPPPDSGPPLTPQEKTLVLEELLTLSKENPQ